MQQPHTVQQPHAGRQLAEQRTPQHALQHTLAGPVRLEGVGIHSGKPGRVTLLPAPEDAGITFIRTDLHGRPEIPASVAHVGPTSRSTTLAAGEARIRTVEHLLAALYGLGIDNALIEVEGEEIPIGDGSALPFVRAIRRAGIQPQSRPRRLVRLPRPLWVCEGEACLVALPADGLRLSYGFVSRRPGLAHQFFECALDPDRPEAFEQELAPARTVGFLEEVEELRRRGLALGGDLDNALVVGPQGLITPLRLPEEIARHKLLDLLGDLALVGGRLEARVLAVATGHRHNARLAAEIAGLAFD